MENRQAKFAQLAITASAALLRVGPAFVASACNDAGAPEQATCTSANCSGYRGCLSDSECGDGFLCDQSSCHAEPLGGAIAADGEDIYYVSQGKLMKVPRGGGVSTVLAEFQWNPWGIAVDSTSVYWTEPEGFRGMDGGHVADGVVMRVSRLGGAPDKLISGITVHSVIGPQQNIALDETNIYWTDLGTFDGHDSADGSVNKISKAGGPAMTIASGEDAPYAIAADGTNVYWTAIGSNSPGLMTVSRDGGTATVLAPVGGGQSLAVGGGYAYWGASSALMRVPTVGGDPIPIASGVSWAIATDSENVYWISSLGLTQILIPLNPCHFFDGAIKKAPLAGGTETVLASGISYSSFLISQIAVDATNVYWVDEAKSSIMTVSKDGGAPTVLVAPPAPPSWSFKWDPPHCPPQ